MAETVAYVLISDGLSQDERARAMRELVDLSAALAHTYETDIPLGNYDEWPVRVQQAAEYLLRASGRPPDTTGAYAQTGVLHRQDSNEATWTAFTTLAGYALDATVWDEHGRDLVSLADEGTSAVFRFSAAQAERAATVAAPGELLPLTTWRTRQHALRRPPRR